MFHSNFNFFKDTLQAFDDLKKKKKAYEVTLFDMEKYIHSESLFSILYIEIKNVKITDEINVTKNALFFLRALTHYRFTFNSGF